MNQQIHEEAAEWLIELRGRSDAATRTRFDQWLAASPEHVRAYLECAAVSETAAAGPRGAPADIEALIERAREASASNVVPIPVPAPALSRPATEGSSSEDSPRFSRHRRFVAAAAVLLTVIGATLGYFTTRNVYTTDVGEQRSILLSDGSTIDMNGRSKVRVRLGAQARSVDLLEGEALFRVARDAARPFVVAANQTRVRAVGTEFAINRRQRTLLVTVVEGTVAVSAPMAAPARATDEILLNANQQVVMSLMSRMRAPPEPRLVDVNDALAWTRRRLVFDSTPLEDVVADFNRHSSRELVIQGRGLQDFHVSGAFSSRDVDPFLRFLRAQPGVKVIEEQDRIVIVHR